MQLDFLVASSNEVIDDMRRRGIATGAAEPLVARETFHHAAGVMDTAVSGICLVNVPVRQDNKVLTRMHEEEAPSLHLHFPGGTGSH